MKRLVLVLMILAFTVSLAAARRDMPSAPLSEDVINKTLPSTTLVLAHSPAVTRNEAPSPILLHGVTINSHPPSPPLQLLPTKIEVHFHFTFILKIVLPIGIATIISIIAWVSCKYCKFKPTVEGSGGGEAGIEIIQTI